MVDIDGALKVQIEVKNYEQVVKSAFQNLHLGLRF